MIDFSKAETTLQTREGFKLLRYTRLTEKCKTREQTIIAVTHDDEFAANCDRIVELSDGAMV